MVGRGPRQTPPLYGAVSPLHREARAGQPLPEPWPATEWAPQVHVDHHWHGVSAEDPAAIWRSQDVPPGTIDDVNQTPQNAVESPLKPAAPR